MTFAEAYTRLQEIHEMLQWDDLIDVQQIITLQTEAKKCYELCQSQLKKLEPEE